MAKAHRKKKASIVREITSSKIVTELSEKPQTLEETITTINDEEERTVLTGSRPSQSILLSQKEIENQPLDELRPVQQSFETPRSNTISDQQNRYLTNQLTQTETRQYESVILRPVQPVQDSAASESIRSSRSSRFDQHLAQANRTNLIESKDQLGQSSYRLVEREQEHKRRNRMM